MWGPWRAELPSETVLMICKLCWGSGNICGCVFQLQLGAWVFHPIDCSIWCIWCLCMVHDKLWGWEVCWLLQNVKYCRLKTFKVTEQVFVFVYVCVCVCVCLCVRLYVCEAQFGSSFCIFWNRTFVIDYCVVTNTDTLAQTAELSETQTLTQFIIRLLHISVTQC